MGGGDKDGSSTLSRLNALYTRIGLPRPPVVILSGYSNNARPRFLGF